jgi:hypothetical protein
MSDALRLLASARVVSRRASVHKNRGYMLFLPSGATNDNAEDRRIFESIRRSFRFTN